MLTLRCLEIRKNKNHEGFHDCIESAYAIMKGLEVNYNFNRKPMPLSKKTPASRSSYSSIRVRDEQMVRFG